MAHLISAVSSTTLEINKDLKFNVKFDPPIPKRRTSDSNIHDFVIQKYGRSFDVKDPRVAIRKKKEDSSDDQDFAKEELTPSSGIRGRSFSSQELSESNSDSDDSTEKTTTTTARSPKKHKRKHTSIKLTSTKNSKYEIPTTTSKKKKHRSNNRHRHRQKNKDHEEDDKSYERGATGLSNNDSHQILHDQTQYLTKPKPLLKHDSNYHARSRLKHVKRFDEVDDSSELSLPSSPRKKHGLRQRKNHKKTTYYNKNKVRSPVKHNTPSSGGIGTWFNNLVKLLSPKETPINTGYARMPNISVIPSSQWFDYLKNKSKSVVASENPQKWVEQVVAIKNITETVVGELENASMAIQQQVGEVLQPQMQEQLQQQLLNKTKEKIDKYINKTQEEIDKHINTSLVIEAQINNLANQTGNLTKLINATANLWQPWIHNVQDDAKVNSFIRHIPNHYSKLFRALERKITDDKWKHVLKKIERAFRTKFNEYIVETTHNKIKSRTGTERVVLNSIGVSNRIIRRLFNYVLGNTNNKAFLRNNYTIDIIEKEIKKHTHNERHRACLKLEICRSSKGFVTYIIDILTILCSSNNEKFEGAFTSLSKVVQKTRFADILGEDVEKGIQQKVAQYDHVNLVYKRSMVAILKNIIANRNSPLIVYGDSQVDQINKTMALLEIINTLDENVAGNLVNLQEWNEIKNNLLNYSTNEEADNIDTTMTALITNIVKVISKLDEQSRAHVVQNAKILLT
ncbi:unnamed protein product [Arctia plantaginis]|uniref:Uncharacterized protein n=1 Tax=Arctia plantaginis TaxID=874455 RepID=A0A8S0ZZ76_ARCPL|nr:unnamed protein product [Arctia plantaginis]